MKKYSGLVVALLLVIGCGTQSFSFLDEQVMQSLLKEYNLEEQRLIAKDLLVVENVCFDQLEHKKTVNNSGSKKKYVATAGAPGARKSTILERFLLSSHAADYGTFVYLDPDQRALKFMVNTYQTLSLSAASVALQDDYSLVQKLAYEKWRSASNYITLTLLEKALKKGSTIVHGTTSTGPLAPAIVKKTKDAGYEIVFLLCSAQDEFRKEAIGYRNREQRFYQSTPEDAVSKGIMFSQRMQFFFEAGDTLYLYWSTSLNKPEELVAIFTQGKEEVINPNLYTAFIEKYTADAQNLLEKSQLILKPWQEIVTSYQKRFTK